MLEERPRLKGAIAPTVAAAAVGTLHGLAEAGRVLVGASFLKSQAGSLTLLLLGAALHGLVLAVPGLLAGLALANRPRWQKISVGFLGGLGLLVTWHLALWWFAVGGEPGAGRSWLIFVLLALVVLVGFGELARRLGERKYVLMVVAVTAVLGAVWVATAIKSVPRRVAADVEARPNVLWVTLDTARADRLSPYGGRVAAPALGRLAREGVLFEKAFAQIGATGPSHATMLTGTGPWRHGALLNLVPMPDDLTSMAEVAWQGGYSTAAFVSAYVLDGRYGYARGFRIYDDRFGRLKGFGDLLLPRTLSALHDRLDPTQVVERRGDRTVDAAMAWLDQAGDGPWFLWVHLFDPHGPYDPPDPFQAMYYEGDPRDPAHDSMEQVDDVPVYLERSLKGITDVDWVIAQYDGELAWTDHQLARLLARLDRDGVMDDTLVVVNADHGESLGEHGVWFDHWDLYDPVTHVPMAMRFPKRLPSGRRVAEVVELTDLAPTMLELMGLRAPATMEGRSMLPAVGTGSARVHARGVCYDREINRAARRQGHDDARWLMASLRAPMSLFLRREAPGAPDAFFDMQQDPDQEVNLMEQDRDDAVFLQHIAMLEEEAGRILEESRGTEARSQVDLTPEEEDKLRSLGYIE